ncbi:MAG: glycerol dehydrogenase [Thermomicrobiales bacterium]|nr:MAG: glycerol dehydrogenase [Thermomicrobiales bacterium]
MRTARGKLLSAVTVEAVLRGDIEADELRITPDALAWQAQIAAAAGRPALATNFLRAAELTRVPDDRLLAMYNALRPGRSTLAELEALASELETEYHAPRCAALVREAAAAYAERDLLPRENHR